jgi:hypothetical protein
MFSICRVELLEQFLLILIRVDGLGDGDLLSVNNGLVQGANVNLVVSKVDSDSLQR